MKRCTKCYETKELELFKRTKQTKSGYGSWCKVCHSTHTIAGVDRAKKNANKRRYMQTLKGREAAKRYRRGRRAAHRNARTAWADRGIIDAMYSRAKALNMVVDHIVPLRSDKVCGLHCEDNMQIISAKDNARKNNLSWPNM